MASKGLNVDLTWGNSTADQDKILARIIESGAEWIRCNVAWNAIEDKGKGQINAGNLANYDYGITKALAAGVKVLLTPYGCPFWASGDPNKVSGGGWPNDKYQVNWKPANNQDYADFCKFLVGHYKPKGIEYFQVWNEPNLIWFWPSGPKASEYVEMLKAAAPVIRNAGGKVVCGGMSSNDYVFVEQMYAAGAKGHFDVMALHPYSCGESPENSWGYPRLDKGCFPAFQEVRKSMLAQGDDKPIFFTEFGWSTATAEEWGCGRSDTVVGDYIKRTYDYLEQFPYVDATFYYQLRNNKYYYDQNNWEGQSGLCRVDMTPKASFTAFKAVVPKPPPIPPPTPPPVPPPTNPPSLSCEITTPIDGSIVKRGTTIYVKVEGKGLSKVIFYIDGKAQHTENYAPWEFNWSLSKRATLGSSRKIKAIGFSTDGMIQIVDSITVRVGR